MLFVLIVSATDENIKETYNQSNDNGIHNATTLELKENLANRNTDIW